MSTNDDHIRTAAYYIWESEGRPNGMNSDHWSRAKTSMLKAKPAAKKKIITKKAAKKKVAAKKRK